MFQQVIRIAFEFAGEGEDGMRICLRSVCAQRTNVSGFGLHTRFLYEKSEEVEEKSGKTNRACHETPEVVLSSGTSRPCVLPSPPTHWAGSECGVPRHEIATAIAQQREEEDTAARKVICKPERHQQINSKRRSLRSQAG